MQVLVLRTTVADGRFVRAGQVYDLSEADARTLLQLGKARPADAVEAQEAPPMTTDSAPVVDVELKKPRGRRK